MSAARTIIGNYCYKKSIKYILKKCKMQDINDLLTISTLKFIHKALFYEQPKSMLKYFIPLPPILFNHKCPQIVHLYIHKCPRAFMNI